TIEHCSWVGQAGWASDYRPEVAAAMAERGVWVSPTISRGWRRFLDNPDSTTLKRIQAAFKDMRARDIPFIASTDAGIPGVYHHHLPQALPVFAAIAGLTPEAVLRTATSAAAKGLGISQVTGQLKPGLSADIVLVHGNPLDDLTVLAEPAAVWVRGVEAKELS
ncbi:MAG: amidohydrolase family protein, partial [Gammaproteobacteria bacterium]|nr:amidohydrolase family protein [Gammaproteobacteria bacterium]